jgi:zinc transport system substrate-binding protein
MILIFSLIISLIGANTNVLVSVAPQKKLLEIIGGNDVKVEVLVKPGFSPATYSITLKQVKKIKDMDAYFYLGLPFEKVWRKKIKNLNKSLKLIDLREGVKLRYFKIKHGDDVHKSFDPHVWLSLKANISMACNIYEYLKVKNKKRQKYYKNNLDNLIKKLLKLDNKIKKDLKNFKGRSVFVYHPSLGYFLRDYSLKQRSLEQHGKEVSIKSLDSFKKLKEKEITKTLFVQKEFLNKKTKTLAKRLGLTIKTIYPLRENFIKTIKLLRDDIKKELTY